MKQSEARLVRANLELQGKLHRARCSVGKLSAEKSRLCWERQRLQASLEVLSDRLATQEQELQALLHGRRCQLGIL